MSIKTKLPWRVLWVISFSFVIMSCSDMEESISPNLESNIKSIPEVLKSLDKGEIAGNENARKSLGNTYATFNAALGKSGLASVFARNELTVFAPNDAAFAELGLNPGNIGELEGLTEILLYHVVSGSVLAADLTEGLVPTLNGAAVEISLTNGPMVNESSIILTDKMARNGVIHGIDAVLMPPVSNVMDLLDDATTGADFTTLRTAIYIVPGLKEEFATRENITVFAPTNAAFAKIGLNSLNISGIDPAILREILRYHVFGGGRLFSEDLVDGPIIMSEGGTLIVNTSSSNTFVIDENGGGSNLIETNIQASNGVIHKIDAVLIPQ